MNNFFTLLLAFIVGIVLGVIFFSSLWWTVNKALISKHSGTWFFSSFMLRMSFLMLAFYFIAQTHWRNLPASLLGFIVGRLIFIRLTRATLNITTTSEEDSHASQP